jgi:predicted RNA-binding protein with PUA-like domain
MPAQPAHRYWLMKSEPSSYSIDDLKKDKKTAWTGIRNYQARNSMRDDMHIGDPILFYYSSCPVTGVYGVAKVASKTYPDPTQFDPKSNYYDPKATQEKPIWYLVDIAYVKTLKEPITLEQMKADTRLSNMPALQRGNRISVTEVGEKEFEILTKSK